MKKTLLVLLAWLLNSAVAAEVFRWTDASGQVHYGERPPVDDAQRIEMPASPASPAAAPSDAATRLERQRRLLESFEYERHRRAEQQARDERQARQRAQQCQRLRNHWRRLSYPGPVFVTGDDGERRYLDDAQREAEKARLRPAFVERCGEPPDG
jgi:hypothetical protein